MFSISAEDSKSNARTGKLKTAHGVIKSPLFMPVATKACAKHISQHELQELGTDAVIANGFVLFLRPGLKIISSLGGIHGFMGWKKSIFTDSGGFQMLSNGFLLKSSDEGITFKSPYDGKKYKITPEKAIEIQNALGSDVAMALDDVPRYGRTRDHITKALKRTHEWAVRCKKAHSNQKQLLFGITQGGTFKDLREKSAAFINSLDFDGIALGGLCVGEEKQQMFEMIKAQSALIDKDKPRYLMGVGSPEDLIEAVQHGIDIFDSRFPTQTARHGDIFTSSGRLRISKGCYSTALEPLDSECSCYVCKSYSRAYLHHLFRSKEPLAMRFASLHNLHFVQNLMGNIRRSISKGLFADFKKEFLEEYSQNK